MRVRDHVALSTAGALVLAPRAGRGILGPWAASILIDADHYLWYCLRQRDASPLAAVRYFGQAHPADHPATRALHGRPALLGALLLAARRPGALKLVLGMAVHVGLDARHEARMRAARAAALRRDDYTCRGCGRRGPTVETHLWRQPPLLPSYRPRNLAALCADCHEAVHARRARSLAELRETLAVQAEPAAGEERPSTGRAA